MKKYFYSVLAASMLFACSQEEIVDVTKGEGQKVTFKVEIPEIGQSRTVGGSELGDGSKADKLIYAMYEENTSDVLVSGCVDEKSERTFEVTVPMAKDIKYDLLFLAYNADNCAFKIANDAKTTNLKALKFEDNQIHNVDAFDAFVGNALAQEVGQVHNVTLKRPFAQLNAATTKQDLEDAKTLMSTIASSKITVSGIHNTYNVFDGATSLSEGTTNFQVTYSSTANSTKMLECDNPQDTYKDGTEITNEPIVVNGTTYYYLNMAYVLPGNANASVKYEFYRDENATELVSQHQIDNVPLQANYRTNIVGNLLTKSEDYTITIDADFEDKEYGKIDGQDYIKVENVEDFYAAFKNEECEIIILNEDLALNANATRSQEDPTLTISSGKTLTIDLNGKKLSATSTQSSKNYNMFDVQGTLTVKNGTMEYEHTGENMGWGASTNLFNVTAGGVLNLEGVTAKNLGGSDMGFVAHLNNWGEVTLNVENCTLESNYVPVRVFNSGYDMNNVTIKNSTLKGGSAAFWVHNYTVADFGTEAKAEAQKALLNLNIYNQGNTFSPDLNGIRYGFTNSVRADAYGITKSVSEDGTVVTLGSVIEDGLVRRGVAGAEENTTIKKAIVGEGITTLYDRTFRRFYALETVELPSTLTTIGAAGSGVFQSCKKLKDIVIPESVTILGEGSFVECTSLESINIPAGITRIEKKVFNASGLKSVEFHAGVTYFGEMAFRDCKQLTEVIINAPEFTMESNTFGIVAAPFTPMTIHVANVAMKTYVESMLTAHAKTYITVVAPEVVSKSEDLKKAITEKKERITISGEIDLADVVLSGYNGTIVGTEGAVLNTRNFTPSSNEAYQLRSNNLTFKNLTIKLPTGGNWLQAGFVGTGNIVFENCKFEGQATLNGAANWTFNKCEFVSTENGAYASFVYGAEKATFNGCSFSGVDRAAKVYGAGGTLNVEYNNCTYTSTTKNKAGVEIDASYATTTVALNGCSQTNMEDLYALKGDKGTVTVDGE